MNPTPTAPPDLFLRLSRGDHDAFREVHSRYGARVASITRRRLGRRLRARLETADVTQQTWAVVAGKAPEAPFASEQAFLGWIAGVVDRRVRREARRWRAGCRLAEREAAGADPDGCPDNRAQRPSQIVQRREAEAAVSMALARLSSKDREVLVLRFVLGLPWRDVAAALGIGEACAQMRCTQAKRRVAKLLG